jgi:hypothetical protein
LRRNVGEHLIYAHIIFDKISEVIQ